jgi:hypothetical protein
MGGTIKNEKLNTNSNMIRNKGEVISLIAANFFSFHSGKIKICRLPAQKHYCYKRKSAIR